MPKLTAQQAADKWRRRAGAAGEDYRLGIDSVTVSPGEQAADNLQKMHDNWLASYNSGKIERGLRGFTLQTWKERAGGVGVTHYTSGVQAAEGKTRSAFESLWPHIQDGQNQVAGMPDLNLDQNIARSEAFIRHMAGYVKPA